jgi:hypothetical protein
MHAKVDIEDVNVMLDAEGISKSIVRIWLMLTTRQIIRFLCREKKEERFLYCLIVFYK